MPHRLKGLRLEVKGRLLVTVIRGNTSMVMWLYTAVKQTPSTCLHSTLHSHVCARSQTISPCSRPTSSSFQLDIRLLPWPHTMNSFQRRSPTLYYTVCVCVYECHSVIPTVGLIFFFFTPWFFFSSLPPFQHLAHVVSHDSSFSSLPLVPIFSCCISVPNLRFAPPFTLQPTPLFLHLKPPLFAPMIDHFFPHPVSTSYLKQFTYETHLIPFSSPQTRLNMRSLAALLLHPLFHTHARTLPCAMCMH